MTISSILSSRLVAAYVPTGQEQIPVKSTRKAQGPDTVSISKQAQQLARDGHEQNKEVIEMQEKDLSENPAEKE